MARPRYVFCAGPHHGPCLNRFLGLLAAMVEQCPVEFSRLRTAGDLSRQIEEQKRVDDDIRCEAADGECCPYGADKPWFDEDVNELWARGECVHRFRAQACDGNEVAILKKFQESGWAREIFDPLGEGQSPKYGASLKETVFRLNQCQGLIEFHSHSHSRPAHWSVSWNWRH